MRKTAIIVLAFAACATAWADKYTRGYVRQDGTVVQGHYSTNPNTTRIDNYSTQGNINPYTGQVGTVNPYGNTVQPVRRIEPGLGAQQAPLAQPDPYGLRNSRKF